MGARILPYPGPPRKSRGDCVVSPDHYARILRETKGDFHQFVRVLWLTGARPMEVARLTAEVIDWTGTALIKLHKNKKRGKRRVIYFPDEAMAVLREQVQRHGATGPLFLGQRGDTFTVRALVDRFKRVSARTGAKVRSYDFRHSHITRSLLAGVPVATVAALVGTSIGMIDRFYGHCGAAAGTLREAAERAAG